jgi:glyoxylase-like metal-dependent hydrolase (beta-lactamase superfamily II)
MIFHQISSGGDRNYGYLVACESSRQAAVVDPSPDPLPCWNRIEELNLQLTYIINTHSHADHAGGNAFFQKKSSASLVTHASTGSGDIRIENAQSLPLGKLSLEFFHTPGHTEDSICLKIDQELVTGDTLFVGKVGGTYSTSAARLEFESLKKLMKLDDDIRIWPGHNYGIRPSSTIGQERSNNPFILRLHDFQDFIWLKENWLEYKREHNIP